MLLSTADAQIRAPNSPRSAPFISALNWAPDIYFEAGNHEELVHMSGAQFRALMKGADLGEFGARI